ncbi:UDP-N-acetylmuramyl pentapeptide phosphotransferase/UDP-N-acetylglucosamine-1-phosphate transferase [Clostridiales Family XIII bacterium PM5-7]
MRRILIIITTGYTLGVLSYATIDILMDSVRPITSQSCFQGFVIIFLIALLMFAYEQATNLLDGTDSLLLDLVIRLAITFGVFLSAAYLFRWPGMLEGRYTLIILTNLPAFFGTYLISYLTVAEYTREINACIKRKRLS